MKKIKTGLKIVIFLAIAAVIFVGVNYIVQPIWPEWNVHNTTHGFYEEPENTIETLFLGSSVTGNGIIPMQLYEDYGICSYNAGTQSQPLMASYYWAEETYRLHSETLDTIVLDLSMLRKQPGDTMYIKILDSLKLTKIKYHFLKDFSEDSSEFLSHLIPVLSYHERWKELTDEDFSKAGYELATYTRGYYFVTDKILELSSSISEIPVPPYVVESSNDAEMDEEAMEYLEKLIEFCNSHDIKLVFIKTPRSDWTDEDHNTAQAIADQNQIEFYDFNYIPYNEEIDFDGATDFKDNGDHLNYYGAEKLTDWMGRYLTEECDNKDVRGENKYAFMDEELADFHREIVSTVLEEITDPAEYLSCLTSEQDYAIFIAVKDDACDSLTEEQRESFKNMGLTELSQITTHASYLAVIDNGNVIKEQMQSMDQEYIDSGNTDEEGEEALCISYDGKLSDGLTYSMESGGYIMGNKSSIQINGTEYSPNKRGLNIVVYDKKLKLVVDQASFDTYASPDRDKPVNEETLEEAIQIDGTGALSGKLLELYMYDRLCDNTETAKVLKQSTDEEENLTAYLAEFWDKEDFSIYLSANGDIADALTESERKTLADMGLTDLSEIEDGDSYLSVIREGDIVTEQCAPGEKELEASGEIYKICSGSTDEETACSLMVQGTEYVGETEGLNIVIYDNVLDQVIDFTVYDTNHIFVSN